MAKKKVVLAFSGGLDTSFCVKYLSEECGYDDIQLLPTPEVLIKKN